MSRFYSKSQDPFAYEDGWLYNALLANEKDYDPGSYCDNRNMIYGVGYGPCVVEREIDWDFFDQLLNKIG